MTTKGSLVFCCFFGQYLCQVNTENILYMYTLTPIAFPVVTKKRLLTPMTYIPISEDKVPILKSICKNRTILKSVIDRYCQMCADPQLKKKH